MSESPPATETIAAAQSFLADALVFLNANGIEVTIPGDPPRYEIDGQRVTEGDIIALAARLTPPGVNKLQ